MGMLGEKSLILKSDDCEELIKCRIHQMKKKGKDGTHEPIAHHVLITGWFNYVRRSNLQVGDYLNFKYHLNPPALHVSVVPKNNPH
jgi:hypothetical protein